MAPATQDEFNPARQEQPHPVFVFAGIARSEKHVTQAATGQASYVLDTSRRFEGSFSRQQLSLLHYLLNSVEEVAKEALCARDPALSLSLV